MRSLQVKLLTILLATLLIAKSSDGQGNGGRAININEEQNEDCPSGFLSYILRPVITTFDQAKRLLGLSRNLRANIQDLIADGFDEIQVQSFKLFMNAHNKTYESREELKRRIGLFLERRNKIEQSVRDFREGLIPFEMRENKFTDWDDDELNLLARASPPKSYNEMTELEREAMLKADGQQPDELTRRTGSNDFPTESSASNEIETQAESGPLVSAVATAYGDVNNLDDGNLTVMAPERIPATKDWRASQCVANPIDQGKCGACYAIATMNTLETMRCIQAKRSPTLSPQQVVDCSTPRAGYNNHGCDGGWPTRVLDYLKDVRVAARELCYPFVRRQEACKLRSTRSDPKCIVSSSPTDTTLRYKLLNNERDILYHVANTGPVITVMKALDSFVYYSRGIYDDQKCSRRRDDVDHAIVIVGYGTENGLDYWLIKNSWGTADWGQGGFGKYRRGRNACSIGHWGWVITS